MPFRSPSASDRHDGGMNRTKKVIITTAAVGAAVIGGGVSYAVAQGTGEDDNETDTPIGGADLERASAVALDATGGGRVSGTEVGDEESYYEVEVTLDDGSQVDVQLDEQFKVVGSEGDDESEAGDS